MAVIVGEHGKWRYREHGGEYGDFTGDQIQELVTSGKLPEDALIQRDGGPWTPATQYGFRAPRHEAVSSVTENRKSGFGALWIVALAIVAGLTFVFWLARPRFTADDVKSISADIKTEFEKRDGVKVSEVYLIQKSDTELQGYAKIKSGNFEFTKTCRADLDTGTRKVLWSCK